MQQAKNIEKAQEIEQKTHERDMLKQLNNTYIRNVNQQRQQKVSQMHSLSM